MLGGRAYPLGHQRQLALYLLNNILGGGEMSSLLNIQLREKKGLVYTVESTYTPLSDTGYWNIYYATEPEHADLCRELVMRTLREFCDKPMPSLQLQRALKQLRGQMAISAENQENNVLSMAKQMLYFQHAPLWQETYQRISRISAHELWETANEIFQAPQCYLAYN